MGSDQDDSERAASFGDIEENLLYRAGAFAGRVFVELVENQEQEFV